ncbi:3'-5' exoribonuclease [Nostoc sp. C052]|uniref:3'-5' exoribonuclease domain-containing protein n=1 Tax=Nostoc sp. C052 TaxID=2576902 RepID=UPI0015C39094|nr:3'-5' exoribonuclease [Nostoc sp. C052]QLE42219.1 3'-5' exoribonuclease [Nostoc sp. C052]
MRHWLYTEFIEDGRTIELISIGIVAEDGRELYLINWDCNFSNANDWVKANVLSHLPFQPIDRPEKGKNVWQSRSDIRDAIASFLGCEFQMNQELNYVLKDGIESPEFWTYYGSYDWVVFAQLFGTMARLPKGLPMYTNDIKQWCKHLGDPELPKQGKGEHNALADARWNRQAWEFLRTFEEDCIVERG